MDLGLIVFEFAGAFEFSNCVLVIIKYYDIHRPDCASAIKACLHQHGVADQANREAFNFKRFTGLDHNDLVVGVFGT